MGVERVPLCLWVELALLLRTFSLGADDRMDSSLMKVAAAGVWDGVAANTALFS